MDPSKPFPILRLPFLAFQEVFKAMDPIEIINFSMISKRAKAVTQQMTFYSKYRICLRIDEGLGIAIRVENELVECTYLMTSDKRMDGKVDEYGEADDPSLIITLDDFVNHNVSIIDFLKTNVKSVTECHLYQSEDENDVDEHAAYLLNNLKVSNRLDTFLHIKNDNLRIIPNNLRQLHIFNSEWIGYERLLEIDCEHVTLRDNQIKNDQWNLFLKKWMAMETNQNLSFLGLDYRDLEEFRAFVLHDIPHEVVDRGVKRNLIFSFLDETEKINGGIDIRRIDGKTATFFVQDNVFSMSVH